MQFTEIKEYVKKRKEELKKEIENFDATSRNHPILAVVQIGHDPASDAYIKGKKKDCEEVGIECWHLPHDKNCSQDEIEKTIIELNGLRSISGIIVQLPLPEHIDAKRLQTLIDPAKDVDGFNKKSDFQPCTPKGIMNWIDYNGYNLEGKNVTVVGRSEIVGKPLVNMMIDRGATVTCCNSKTSRYSLKHKLINSDVIVSAVGKKGVISRRHIDEVICDLVVDVGINRDENGKLCGDVDASGFRCDNTYVTPVPGGVGLLTRLALLENTFEAYKNSRNRINSKINCIYTIMTMTDLKEGNNGWADMGAVSIPGWYTNKDDAFDAVKSNAADIQEHCYDYALIECHEEGLYPTNSFFQRWWFKYDKETDTYCEIDEPYFVKNQSGFTIG